MQRLHPDAAGGVIVDQQGKILLVHQTYGEKKWNLPGGTRERGEAPWETVVRECKEEINVTIQPADCVLSGLYYWPHRDAYHFTFLIRNWTGVPKPDNVEIDQVAFFPIYQLPSPISNFTIQRIQHALQMKTSTFFGKQNLADYQLGDPNRIKRL